MIRQLKAQARKTVFTPRRPHFVWVTTLYIIITWVALRQLQLNLSDIWRFMSAWNQESLAALDTLRRTGVMPTLQIPVFEVTVFGTLFFIVPWIFRWMMGLGYLYYARGTIRGETLGFRSLFEGFNYFVRAILVRLLHLLFMLIGLPLFVVPGIVFFCGFSQVNLLLLDHPDKAVIWLFKESWRLMHGRKWEFFVLKLSFIGWFLLTEIPIINLAARLWLIPYSTTTGVHYYNGITGQGPMPEPVWKRPGMY